MLSDRERPGARRPAARAAAGRAPRAATSLILLLGVAAALGLAAPALTQAVEPPAPFAVADAGVDAAASAAAAAEAPPSAAAPAAQALADDPTEAAATPRPTARDPWRRFNRGSYAFNNVLDRALVGPVARAYLKVTPAPLRRRLGKIVDNLREPSTVVNEVLQGHPVRALRASARFVTNSTVGLLGAFDVASHVGLERQRADFGQTLGRYGVGSGPYLYLPVVGPLNVRDGLGRVVDALTDPISLATGGVGTDFAAGRLGVTALDDRAEAEATLAGIAQQATDPYATIRSAYEQNREAVIRQATGAAEDLPDFDTPPDAPAAAAVPVASGVRLESRHWTEPLY